MQLKGFARRIGNGSHSRIPGKRAEAQFNGLVDSQEAADKLCISDVIHKTFVEVNEKGIEAVAAAAVMMSPKAAAAAGERNSVRTEISAPISRSCLLSATPNRVAFFSSAAW